MHTSAVAVAINKLDAVPNRVLNGRPPPLDKSLRSLPREWRATLAQLRSGFCRRLKSYKSMLDPTVSASCPDCQTDVHSTSHLFECASFPSTLYSIDLWVNPIHVANFLSRIPSFSDLPPVDQPSTPLNPRPIIGPLPQAVPPPPPPPPPPSGRHFPSPSSSGTAASFPGFIYGLH